MSCLIAAAYDAFGAIGGQLVSGLLLPCVITLVPTVFIYRYVRRRNIDYTSGRPTEVDAW